MYTFISMATLRLKDIVKMKDGEVKAQKEWGKKNIHIM